MSIARWGYKFWVGFSEEATSFSSIAARICSDCNHFRAPDSSNVIDNLLELLVKCIASLRFSRRIVKSNSEKLRKKCEYMG